MRNEPTSTVSRSTYPLRMYSAIPITTNRSATTTARPTDDAPANTTIGSEPTNTPATGSSVHNPAHTPSAAGPGTPAARAMMYASNPPITASSSRIRA